MEIKVGIQHVNREIVVETGSRPPMSKNVSSIAVGDQSWIRRAGPQGADLCRSRHVDRRGECAARRLQRCLVDLFARAIRR